MSFPPISITNSFIIETSSPLLFQEFSSLLPPLDQIRSPFCRSRMNGYSRIRNDSTSRSKSVDFADLTFQHRTPSFISSSSQFRFQEAKPNLSNAAKIRTKHSSIPEEGVGEVFGIILSQKQSICSAPDKSAPPEQKALPEQEGQLSTVKSLSVKRSSSVSQGYSRIRNQLELAAENEDKCGMKLTTQNRCVKKRGKYLKAFMRVFGL